MTGRWRDGLGWIIVLLVVAGVAAAGITAWLSNADKSVTVVVGLVTAAVVGVMAPQAQQMLGGTQQRRALLARRAAGASRGRLPRLGDIGLGELGVRAPREASGQPRSQSVYASRHALDPALADAFAKQRFVVIYGPSAAGKSRSSAEVARNLWRRRPVLVPFQQQGALAELVDAGIRPQTIVWLDDLDRHLDAGVDAGLVRRLLDVSGVRIIATMRASAYETFKPGTLRPVGADVIDNAHQVRFTDWDQEDRDQASTLLSGQPGQSDVVAALRRGTGLGSYLSAVPDLIKQLQQGAPPPDGVAVVRVVADWYRSGLTRPVPVSWVRRLYPDYLPGDDVTLVSRFNEGLVWATFPVSGARLVTQPTDGSGLVIHDSVLEYLSATLPPGLPEPTWRAISAELTTHRSLDELTAVGVIAYRVHGDPILAERLLEMAADAGYTVAANNLGLLLLAAGRVPEGEHRLQVAAEAGQAVAANNLGVLMEQLGRVPEAEHWYQVAAGRGQAVAANNLGVLMERLGRVPEAENWYRVAADAGHADAANNLGVLLQQSGRVPEAENWYQAAADAGHAYAASNLHAAVRGSRRKERRRASATLGMINGGLRRRVAASDIPGAIDRIQRLAESAELILAEDVGLQQVMTNVEQAINLVNRDGSLAQLEATAAACEQAARLTPSPLLRATFRALLGTVLAAKFGHTAELADVDAATNAFQQAVDAAPEANPIRGVYAERLITLQRARAAFASAVGHDGLQEQVQQIAIDSRDLIWL